MDKQDFNPQIIEHPIVSTITNEIPVIRSISNYWRETIRQTRDKRLIEFLLNISERIATIEDNSPIKKVEKNHIGSDDYFVTIEQLTEFAVKTNDENKIEYLKRFAINYATEKRPDITLKEVYLNLVGQLSGMHFVILNIVYLKQCKLSKIDLTSILEMPERSESICLDEISKIIDIDSELTLTLLYSLDNNGLIKMKFDKINNPCVIIEPIGLKLMTFLSE